MSIAGNQDFIKEREVLLGALFFVLFLTYKILRYSINGLRNKKITVWSKGVFITSLEGKKAIYFSLFWFVVAILLVLILLKFLYIFISSPNELL